MSAGGVITAREAAMLQEAYRALQGGDAASALASVRRVLAAAPRAAPALHLEALCARRLGDAPGAERAFRAALSETPHDVEILSNYSAFLRQQGRSREAVAQLELACSLQPGRAESWVSLALARADLGEVAAARAAAEKATRTAPQSARAWRALGAVHKQAGDLTAAEEALQRAVAVAPNDGEAFLALGVVRRLSGEPGQALQHFARARSLGLDTAQLLDAEAGALLDLGDLDGAIARARALTSAAPAYVPGHVMLAQMLWQQGAEKNDSFAAFRAAVAAQPHNRALRAALASELVQGGRPAEALEHLEALRREGDDPNLVLTQADALRLVGQNDEATRLLAECLPRMQQAPHFRTAYARQLIRSGEPDAAAEHALLATELDPIDQEAWAVLSVAWRLLDDPREHWLCDYERLVTRGEIEPPSGYASLQAFLDRLIETLTALHAAKREPVNQSLRHGSQTTGTLFGRSDPVIAEAAAAIAKTRDALISALPRDDKHPFLRRNTGRARYVGSWSVRLWSSGRHISHFHPEGWLSSAFYVQLPASVTRVDSAEGRIEFGVPPDDVGVHLPARRTVDPQAGTLVLFPSYMWHGTTAFHDETTPRMTIAFDAQPAD